MYSVSYIARFAAKVSGDIDADMKLRVWHPGDGVTVGCTIKSQVRPSFRTYNFPEDINTNHAVHLLVIKARRYLSTCQICMKQAGNVQISFDRQLGSPIRPITGECSVTHVQSTNK